MTEQNISTRLETIIRESFNLEQNVSELYFLFFELFPNDEDFWWQLVEEEKNHAALLKSGLEYFQPANKFPDRIVCTNIESLVSTNKRIVALTTLFRKQAPDRETAFNCAYAIETSAGELHYQRFMEDIASMSSVERIFSQLNQDDISHANRILDYMKNHDISRTNTFTL